MERSLADVLAEQGWEPGPLVGWRKDDRSIYVDDERGLEFYDAGTLIWYVPVADDGEAVDVLCAKRVLPAELSSMYLAALTAPLGEWLPTLMKAYRDGQIETGSSQEFGPDRDDDRGAFHSRDYTAPEPAPVPAGVDGTHLGTRGAS